MAPLCISGLGWLGMSPGLFTHPVWDGCIKAIGPHCLPLPFRAACFDASPSLHGLTPPTVASTRPRAMATRCNFAASSTLLLDGLSLALFRCAHVRSRTAAHMKVKITKTSAALRRRAALMGEIKKEAGRVTDHLRAMPTSDKKNTIKVVT